MTRKIALLVIGIIACSSMLLTLGPTEDAQAQCTTRNYNGVIVNSTGCLEYTPFTPAATPTPKPKPTSSAVVSADTVGATTGSAGNASIAFTGSESRVLGYVGAGLIGFGALAVAASRRKSDSELD